MRRLRTTKSAPTRAFITALVSVMTVTACGGGETEPGAEPSADLATTSTTGFDTTPPVASDSAESGGDGVVDPGVEVDTCSLLSGDEISTALGGPGEPDPWEAPPSFFACTWTAADGGTVFASVTVHPDQEAAETIFVNWMTSNGYTEVTGIGDVAYTGSEITLNVLSGIYEVEVDVVDDDVETSKQLVGAILERLP